MKEILKGSILFAILLIVGSCSNKEQLVQLQTENVTLTKQLKDMNLKLDDQRKRTKFAQEEAKMAKTRSEEILKNCKK